MRIPGSNIQTAAEVERPIPEKAIFWGSQVGGESKFPSIQDAWNRKNCASPEPMKAFSDAVINAQERVWIVDQYLLIPDGKNSNCEKRIEEILKWLPVELAASDIRLLTKTHQEIKEEDLKKFQQREQKINNYSARRGKTCRIEIRTHLAKKGHDVIHDRFAIIDDELWHFGGTVGGFHSCVSAASRGWRASEHDAINFFEEVWKVRDQNE